MRTEKEVYIGQGFQKLEHEQTCRYTDENIAAAVTRLRYWQDNELAIDRSRVRVLAGHHCVMASGQ